MTQRELWNKKFSKEEYLYGKEENEFLSCEYKNFSKASSLLCAGEGEGRNAVFLAKKGFKITAIDASNIALEKLDKLALREDVKVNTLCIDLNDWIVKEKYDSCLISFLHLNKEEKVKILRKIENSLEKDAFLLMEVFSKKQLNYSSGGPKDEDLLYSIKEIKDAFLNCTFHKLEELEVSLDEGRGHQGKASVIRVIAQKK